MHTTTTTNPNFTATPATPAVDDIWGDGRPGARIAMLADIARRGYSPVGYSTVAALTFGGALVESVTVHAYGEIMTSVKVRGYNLDGVENADVTRFYMIDGRWVDSVGIDLAPADDSSLSRHIASVTGHAD